jgi:hypothetical protein
MKAHQIFNHGLPAELMELVDISEPNAQEAVRLSAAMKEITSVYGER